MKKLIILSFLIALLIGPAVALNPNNSDDILGEWKYEVEAAPYGYEAGILVFYRTEGKLLGKVLLNQNDKIELQNVSFTEGELKFGLYVENDYVSIKAKIDGNKLDGTVSTPEGPKKIKAEKIVKE